MLEILRKQKHTNRQRDKQSDGDTNSTTDVAVSTSMDKD